MTHRERILAAIRGEVPDRLPWVPRLEFWHRAHLRRAFLDDCRTHGLKSLYKPADGKEPYLTSLTHLDKFFAVRKVNTITADEIRRFVKERQGANASNGTIAARSLL